MISDVLSDARAELERYLLEFRDIYGDDPFREDVEWVMERMEEIRFYLDAAPDIKPPLPSFSERFIDRTSEN